jgi:CBS domain containing-hemolysin-like protein
MVFSTTLLVTSMCIVLIASLITLYFLDQNYEYKELLSGALASILIVFFGEVIPKIVYQKNADQFAPWVAYPVYGAFFMLYPITKILSLYTNSLANAVGPMEVLLTGRSGSARDEMRLMLKTEKQPSEINPVEKVMVQRILDFKKNLAKNAMIPLVQVEAIAVNDSLEEGLRAYARHQHSRMPVFSEWIHNIIGVLEVADLLNVPNKNLPIQKYLNSAFYVAETQSLYEVLQAMGKGGHEMAIVVDEHGGATGILTLEDIFETIVGDIRDEYDPHTQAYRQIGPNSWVIQASMRIVQLNEELGLDVPTGDYETLAGFLLDHFGRIPESQDEYICDTAHKKLKFTIQIANQKQIHSVQLEVIEKPSQSGE